MFGTDLKSARAKNAELLTQIAQAKQARNIIGDRIIGESRTLTADERAAFVAGGRRIDGLEADLAAHKPVLDAAEAQNERERAWRPGSPDPDREAGDRAMRAAGVHVQGRGYDGAALARPTGRTFAQMFGEAAGASDGWTSPGEYLSVIAHGLHDGRLRADSQSEGTASLGGFLVPPEFYGSILNQALEQEVVRPRARVFPMASSELNVPCFDDADRSSGAVAGLELQFLGEAGSTDFQAAKLRVLKLHARKAALFVSASNELLTDAVAFETSLTEALGRSLAFGLDHHFLWGDGAAGPLGAFASPAAITVARTSTNKVLYDDCLQMFSRLSPANIGNAIWIAHPSLIPQLGALTLPVGTGGSFIPALSNTNGTWNLLSRPLIYSEKMKSVGLAGDLALADFSAYIIGLRREAALEKSMHVGFLTDSTAFRLIARLDGQPALNAPITPLSGPTQSPFVLLGDEE